MKILAPAIRFLFFSFLLIAGLYFARGFLIPFCLAGLLAMLFLPLSQRLEARGFNRGVAALACIAGLLLVIAALILLLRWQLQDLVKDLAGIEQRITGFIHQVQQYISSTIGVSEQEQKKLLQQQSSSGSGKASGIASAIMGSLMGIAVNTVLVFVYIFLFLYYRGHLKKFVLKLVPPPKHSKTTTVMYKSTQVAQQYITGLALMIVTLWVLYGIGFSIAGVKYALFFAILCGLLEIVPFVGNLTGTSLTIIVSLAQGGNSNIIIGILVVYGIVQFIQTYILEPLIVGAEVNINPLFTILAIVAGETVWGIGGMILAIPLLGIVKIICDHIEPLKPYGFLIGQDAEQSSENWTDKIKRWFKKKR